MAVNQRRLVITMIMAMLGAFEVSCLRWEFPRASCVEERIALESSVSGERLAGATAIIAKTNDLRGQTPREYIASKGERLGALDNDGAFVLRIDGTRSVHDFQTDEFRPVYSIIVIGVHEGESTHVVMIRLKMVSLLVPYDDGAGHSVIDDVHIDGEATPLSYRFDFASSMRLADPLLPGDTVEYPCGWFP